MHCEAQPEYRPPIAQTSEHEVGKQWSKVWRSDEKTGPETNFSRPLVEEEHIAQETNGDTWWCVREDPR